MVFSASLALAQERVTLDQAIVSVAPGGNSTISFPHKVITDGDIEISIGSGSHSTWSPDGKKLAYFVGNVYQFDLWIRESGEAPRKLVSLDSEHRGNIAWLPDSQWVVIWGKLPDAPYSETGYHAISIINGDSHFLHEDDLADFHGTGPSSSEMWLYHLERTEEFFSRTAFVSSTPTGVAFIADWYERKIGFVSIVDGVPIVVEYELEHSWANTRIIPNSRFISMKKEFESRTNLFMDIESGTIAHTLEESPPNARFETFWGENHILYSYRALTHSISPMATEEISKEGWLHLGFYPDLDGFSYDQSILFLHNRALQRGKEDTTIIRTVGYDFGRIQPIGDNRVVLSVITSSVPAIQAIQDGANPEDIEHLFAHVEIYVMENGEILYSRDGTLPHGNSGSFTMLIDE